jgi:SAM-dependent methyltransferase
MMDLKACVEQYIADSEAVIPGAEDVFVGDGDFRAIGAEFLGHLIEIADLSDDETIVDIGCGQGRLALPMTYALSSEGRYIGLDVVAEGITWCEKVIAPRHPGFSFRHVDVHHPLYNPGGSMASDAVHLPVKDASADLATLISVFTHFDANMARHYASEIARILRPGGRCFATFFLMTPERADAGFEVISRYPFDLAPGGPIYSPPEDTVLGAVAMDESFVRTCFADAGLVLREPIAYGFWPTENVEHGVTYQDICVFEAPASDT